MPRRPRLWAAGATHHMQPRTARAEATLTSAASCMDREARASRGKGAMLTRAWELVTLAGVEAYPKRVGDLATAMGMNAGSVNRALSRAVAREREERAFHQPKLALEERLAGIEAGDFPKKVRW
jgi:hypothetical protein